ncbi:hypothetical protein GALL_146850 [mine drainage metagenome]|uniref:Uncharacterized protein n=1 Tax=mine drainage metagenome TaxID=410659 RepID=A0A1J5SG83_9ZZZZ
MTTNDIAGKLWNLCNVLKDNGVTCQHMTCFLCGYPGHDAMHDEQ